MSNKSSGVIVIVALMMVSVIVMVTEQLIRSVFVGTRFITTMVEREKAKALALSGVQIAMAQLLPPDEKDSEKKDEDQNQSQQDNAGKKVKKLLQVLLPNLNRWQSFSFDDKKEGVDGSLKICIVSEQGKINLNEAFDFEKQEFKKEYASFLAGLGIENQLQPGELLKILQDFFVKRKKKLNDLSELLEIKTLQNIEFFYKPPLSPSGKNEKPEHNKKVTLQDVFTLWTPTAELNLLLFSDALCQMFQVRQPRAGDRVVLKEAYKTFVSNYQDGRLQNLDQNWKNFALIFGEKPPALKNLQALMAKQFEPVYYSVLSYGNVGKTEQQLLAIIKKVGKKVVQQAGNQAEQQEQDDENRERFKIIRLYWL